MITVSAESLATAQEAIVRLEPYAHRMPLGLVRLPLDQRPNPTTGEAIRDLPVPDKYIGRIGAAGVSAFADSFRDISRIPAEERIALAQRAVEARGSDEELSDNAQISRILAEDVLMYTLSEEERAQVLREAA